MLPLHIKQQRIGVLEKKNQFSNWIFTEALGGCSTRVDLDFHLLLQIKATHLGGTSLQNGKEEEASKTVLTDQQSLTPTFFEFWIWNFKSYQNWYNAFPRRILCNQNLRIVSHQNNTNLFQWCHPWTRLFNSNVFMRLFGQANKLRLH